MLSLELCQKLKDARFPLKAASQQDGICKLPMHRVGGEGEWNQWWLEPTLSELIKEIGMKFDQLWYPPNDLGEVWCASVKHDYRKMITGDHVEGPTPEIAVAHLYLALHNTP